MPNNQIFPNSTLPLTGDVQSTPGDPTVRVQGFQKTPVSSTPPQDGQVYVYVADINQWVAADPIVSGPNAPGTPPTVYPVQVGGQDDGNIVQELRTDTYGGIRSVRIETLLENLLLEVRALKAAVINLDNTTLDLDYQADDYTDTDLGTGV